MQWVIALHVIFVITWFSALFYLPRLFVYHANCTDEIGSARFKIMERRLFRGIMLPSAILVLITGEILLEVYGWADRPHILWLHVKLCLVFLLYVYMIFCWKYLRDFKHDCNKHSHVFYRWFNEVPSVLLVAIILLVIVKPF